MKLYPHMGSKKPSPVEVLQDGIFKPCRKCWKDKHHSTRAQKHCDDCRKELARVH